MMAHPQVSVIIVNWHSEDLLALALSALNSQTVAPDRVFVVNNGCDKEIPLPCYTRGPIAVLQMNRNEGFAVANNRAIEIDEESEWVALLNPDAIPHETWLESLLDATKRYPEVSAFGSRQLMSENHGVVDGLGDVYHVSGSIWREGHGQPDDEFGSADREIFAPCAAAALYRRSAFIDVGGFDEDFFCYVEDVDLGFRLRLNGHRAMLIPTAVVYHLGGATSGGRQSDFAVYHGHRNLVWAYAKNMPGLRVWWYLPQHFFLNIFTVLYFVAQGRGSIILRAKWDALVGLRGALRKRRKIQRTSRVVPSQVCSLMSTNVFSPYRRNRAG